MKVKTNFGAFHQVKFIYSFSTLDVIEHRVFTMLQEFDYDYSNKALNVEYEFRTADGFITGNVVNLMISRVQFNIM